MADTQLSRFEKQHRIRLAAAWQRTIGKHCVKVHLPDEVAAPEGCYHRQFNQPSNLDPAERVFLCIDSWTGTLVRIQLNSDLLVVDGEESMVIDVTEKLRSFNQLTIELEAVADHIGIDSTARLVIAS